MSDAPFKPTREQLRAAEGAFLRDVIAPGLKVVFCGINPSLYSAAVGHHFARPGNRFWPTLLAAGFTERLLSPFEDHTLLERGYGSTNLVRRATARADELTADELAAGRRQLERKIRRYAPRYLAMVGMTAYRTAWNQPKATLGLQSESIGKTSIWVLPNPSGLNANYQLAQLAEVFGELRAAVEKEGKKKGNTNRR
jgi:TDG/mug DNA glycosylase family protein